MNFRGYTCALCIIFFCINANAQKLKKNELDKFTKEHIKETSYENIWRNAMFGGLIEAKIRKSNDDITLWLYLHLTNSFIIGLDYKSYLLLQNDSSIILKCIAGTVGNASKHVWHGQAGYRISLEDAKALSESPLKAIRIDFGDKYDTYTIKEHNATAIRDMLKLVTQ